MDVAQTKEQLKDNFSFKAFLRGLAVVGGLYLLLALWLVFTSESTLEKQYKRLASQTVIVEWQTGETPRKPHDTTADSHSAHETPESPHGIEDEAHQNYAPPQVMESGLLEAPIDGLYEMGPDGHMPVIRAKDRLTPFKAYRRPFDIFAQEKPIVAIAVMGVGLSDIATESAVRSLPPEISLILSPYTPNPDFWVHESRTRGHEIWLTLPVETRDFPRDDPGPHTMLIGAPERENTAKLEWVLSRTDGYIGFVTPPEPDFIKSVNDMRPVIGNVYNRGLAFIDGSSNPSMIPQTMAYGMKAPYGTVDLWIDENGTQEEIGAALKKLEDIARSKGVATGIIQPLPVSFQKVLKWVETLPDKGLVLAPLSATTGQ